MEVEKLWQTVEDNLCNMCLLFLVVLFMRFLSGIFDYKIFNSHKNREYFGSLSTRSLSTITWLVLLQYVI